MRVETIGDARWVRIYALCEYPDVVRYVGKTTRWLHERHKQHIYEAKKAPLPRLPVHRWLRKQIVSGAWLTIQLLENVQADADWGDRERYWIAKFRGDGARLLNLTEGGEGLPGHSFSQEHRDKISTALRTGAEFACETCGAKFWRKRKDIAKGDCRFCSRQCYAASLKGISRPMPAAATERGIEAAAEKRRSQTHCKRGHPLSGENLFMTSSGARGCKECRKIHKKTYLARHKE